MPTQLSFIPDPKPRDTRGRYTTKREATLAQREKRIAWLEFRNEQLERQADALIKAQSVLLLEINKLKSINL